MNKVIKVIVPVLLALIVLISICWYLFIYDRSFTQEFLLSRARAADARGNYSTATWFYDLAYRHSHEDEDVAIELSEQFKSIGNYTKAEYTLSNAIADGGSSKLYIALCKTYIEQDKLRDAVTMLDNIADPAIKAELDALRPQTPDATPDDGYYNEYINVTITSNEGTVYASINGEYPSVKDQPLSGPLTLSGGETVIYALTISENGLVSPLRVLGYTVAGVIEEVTISDPALNTIVREALNVSDNHTLFTNELWNITSLEITQDVKDLSELSKMPFIEYLSIPQGEYQNLAAISALTHLNTLTIDGVTLKSEDITAIASLPELASLTMARCNLSNVSALTSCTGITYLDLNNNTIRDLEPLTAMSGLEYLDISHNAVTHLTALTGAANLKELNASYNSISSTVALSGCKNLEVLDMAYNALTSLEGLEKLTNLTKIVAHHNQISDITHLSALSKLTDLDVSNNVLADISTLSGINSLKVLNFEYNQVISLPTFSKDSELSTINGANNLLTSLEALKGLNQLNFVFMDNNIGISSVASLSNCSALIEVSVLGTGATDVSDLKEMDVIVHYTPY